MQTGEIPTPRFVLNTGWCVVCAGRGAGGGEGTHLSYSLVLNMATLKEEEEEEVLPPSSEAGGGIVAGGALSVVGSAAVSAASNTGLGFAGTRMNSVFG